MIECSNVSEIPGIYGSFKIDEKLIQKVWAEQNFSSINLNTDLGLPLKILSPGKWNLSEEGPDFKNASILLNNKEVTGDVEIHFNSKDWYKHNHHLDPNFKKVILHVVLFPSRNENYICKNIEGKKIPLICLLPHLTKSIEETIESYTLQSLTKYKSSLPFNLHSTETLHEIKEANIELSKARWLQKLNFAEQRLKKFSPEETIHQFFLEVLGYSRNRMQMNELAVNFKASWWMCNESSANLAYDSISTWKTVGVRPANYPKLRLEQYLNLWKINPKWIYKLSKLDVIKHSEFSKTNRKNLNIKSLQQKIMGILSNVFGENKINTICIDALFPILSKIHNRDYFPFWFHWYCGDFPPILKKISKEAKIGGHNKSSPYSNGVLQGVLGYCIEKKILE